MVNDARGCRPLFRTYGAGGAEGPGIDFLPAADSAVRFGGRGNRGIVGEKFPMSPVR